MEILFFFGAGASAPFGIPTMKQMVIDFEDSLSKNGTESEKEVYGDIKKKLEAIIGKSIDLETVFTVIDGIMNYDVESLGLLSIYASAISYAEPLTSSRPSKERVAACEVLRKKFQSFVRERCMIPKESFNRIHSVYKDFFDKVFNTFGGSLHIGQGGCYWDNSWSLFTTNYDTCLEYYWQEKAAIRLNTGFEFNENRNRRVLNPNQLIVPRMEVRGDELRLIKLHGSINWKVEKDGTTIELLDVPERSYMGREYITELMIYPVLQKELYVQPYVSMFTQLNNDLESKELWMVIGYSFSDPIIRNIFIKNSSEKKKIVLVHPEAKKVLLERLHDLKGNVIPLEKKFGEHSDYMQVNNEIVECLRSIR